MLLCIVSRNVLMLECFVIWLRCALRGYLFFIAICVCVCVCVVNVVVVLLYVDTFPLQYYTFVACLCGVFVCYVCIYVVILDHFVCLKDVNKSDIDISRHPNKLH